MSKIDDLKKHYSEPDDYNISDVLDDIQTLLAHIDSLEKQAATYIDLAAKHSREASILEQKLAKAKLALEFYGDKTNYGPTKWNNPKGQDEYNTLIPNDFSEKDEHEKVFAGTLARTTLAEIGDL